MLLDEIGDYLTALGIVGGSTGWTLKKSFMPTSPNQVVCIYETPGEVPEIVAGDPKEKIYDKPGFQVRVRANPFDYESLRKKLRQIFDNLHQNEPPQTSGEIYVYVYAVSSGPMPMGIDSNNRPEATWNFRSMRRRD